MKKKIIITTLCLFLGGAGYYLFKPDSKGTDTFITINPQKGSISNTVLATGSVKALQKVSVGAQVSGQIKKLYVKLGDHVKTGDMIAQIDNTTQLNTYNTDEANLNIYQAQQKTKEVAYQIAKTQFNRQNNLYKNNATSKEDLENSRNSLSLALSDLEEVKAQVKKAQITLDTDKINLGYTKITSPLDGYIISVPVEEGQTVNSNQTTPTIVQIADLSKVLIKQEISEGDITKVKPGQDVEFTILSDPEKIYKTKLDSIDPADTTMTDDNSSVTSTSSTSTSSAIYYYGNLIVDNPNNELRIAMTTNSSIIINKADDVLYIPKIAVKSKGDKQYVMVLENENKTIEKEIITGVSDDINIEIKSGINEKDKVITSQTNSNEVVSSIKMRPGRM